MSVAASRPFEGFDLTEFWDDGEYALRMHVEAPFTDEMLRSVEAELGYTLPSSYVWLMRQHNGGTPAKSCHPMRERTSWAEDHVAITSISGIGRNKRYSLCGDLGTAFMIDEWGYPKIGVVVCDCPSAGHDVIMLDYRKCGPHGEPEVVHVDQECEYKVTFVAKDFESFVRGLRSDDDFEIG
jgi:hypothetical protein